jgi:hypothetical protein
VHDGDHVTAGQLLIRLDETASRADLDFCLAVSPVHPNSLTSAMQLSRL